MNDNLAPVFLDNKPVSLKDPKPKLSAILSASGRPETTDVKWLQFQANSPGKSLRSEEVLDRTTDPSKPIYLTSAKGQSSGGQGQSSGGGQGQWSGGQGQSTGGQAQSSGGQGTQRREGDAGSPTGRASSLGNEPRSAQSSGGKTTDVEQSTDQDDDSGMQDDADAGGEPGKKSGNP